METFSLIQINHIQNIQIDRKRKGEIVNRYLFEVLCFIEKNGKKEYGIREISDAIQISGNTVSKSLQEAKISGYIEGKQMLSITSKGIEALEPYRVKKAVIMAAGFGARMMPATADRPKPMVSVARLIEYGNTVKAIGYRDEMFVAAIPHKETGECCKIIESIIGVKTTPLPNYLKIN